MMKTAPIILFIIKNDIHLRYRRTKHQLLIAKKNLSLPDPLQCHYFLISQLIHRIFAARLSGFLTNTCSSAMKIKLNSCLDVNNTIFARTEDTK